MTRASVWLLGLCILVGWNSRLEAQPCPSTPDCNSNGVADDCELDCNARLDGSCMRCVPPARPPACGTGVDCDDNNTLDECEDCNKNGVPDHCDITCNASNGVCRMCSSCSTHTDCDRNMTPDDCDGVNNCPTISAWITQHNDVLLPERVGLFDKASPGDTFVIDFYAKCWSQSTRFPEADNLRGYQLAIDYNSFFSGESGNILPVGFEEITDPTDSCPTSDPPCPPNAPVPGCANEDNAFVNVRHSFDSELDFVFRREVVGTCLVPLGIQYNECGYVYGVALAAQGCTLPGNLCPNPGFKPQYLASVRVQVSDDAFGTFALCLDDRDVSEIPDGPDYSYLRPHITGNQPRITPLLFECATIVVGDVPDCAAEIQDARPTSNSIDARQVSEVDGTNPAGWNSFEIDFDFPDGTCTILSSNFDVSSVPPGGSPSVNDVDVIDDDTRRIGLTGAIPHNKWTEFEYTDTDQTVSQTCLGFVQGDVNGNGSANADDARRLVDCLRGVQMCAIHQSDANRSGAANPRDVLRVVDFLNGAGIYDLPIASIGGSPCP